VARSKARSSLLVHKRDVSTLFTRVSRKELLQSLSERCQVTGIDGVWVFERGWHKGTGFPGVFSRGGIDSCIIPLVNSIN
jgi:hypothetical protein